MTAKTFDVLHLTTVHRWDDNRIFHKECCSLAAAGLSVGLLAGDAPGGLVQGVETVRLGRPPAGRLGRMLLGVPRLLWRALRIPARVWHIHDPELIPAALVGKVLGRRIVYDVHEDYPLDILCKPWIAAPLRRPVAAAFAFFERLATRPFDLLVASTPRIGTRLSRFHPRTTVVENYPRLEELAAPSAEDGRERRDIVYLGYLTGIRGIRTLVDAMAQVREGRLLLAGEFSDPDLEQYVRARLSPGHIEYVGWVKREQLEGLFRGAAVGVAPLHAIPSFVESLPNKLFEYMAGGLPVVASDFPDWKALVEGLEVGWCTPPGDAAALAERLRQVLAHPEEARSRGHRGRAAVEQRFSWAVAFARLQQAYRTLLPAPTARSSR